MRMINDLESRLSQLMAVTDTHRVALRKAMRAPLQDMGAMLEPGNMEEEEARYKADEFAMQFAWVPFPAHIIAYFGQKEYGVGDYLLRNNGFRSKTGICNCC